MDSSGVLPERSASTAKSIIMMAFFFTMPIKRMIPISAMTLNSVWNANNARSAPTPADGKRRENRDRMNIAFIKHAQHDIDRQ